MKKDNKKDLTNNRQIALYYLQVFADTTREPFLILDSELRVVGVSPSFCEKFNVTEEQTVGEFIYNLGNNQWDIPDLKKLLENILPDDKVFNNFEVVHDFPEIGKKTMLLNARQLDGTNHILLAIEDITVKKELEKKLANYNKELEKEVAKKTKELRANIDELEKMNKIMVGRELKMAEQKKEIAKLKKDK